MLQQPKNLKKKSKHQKKPLELKTTISQTLDYNTRNQKQQKKQSIYRSAKLPQKKISLEQKDKKLIDLYQRIEQNDRDQVDSENSDDLLLCDLQKKQENEKSGQERPKTRNLDKRSMLFSRFVKDSGKVERKLNAIQEKVNEKIRKYSIQSKIQQIQAMKKRQPAFKTPQESSTVHNLVNASKILQKHNSLIRLQNTEALTEINLSNMKLTHLSILSLKEKIIKSSKLKVLDLSYNNLTNKSMSSLTQLLSQNIIEEFSIKWNQFTYEGIVELIESVTYSAHLVSLDLGYNKLANHSIKFTDTFIKFFDENKYVLHLNMEMCHITQQQAQILADHYNLKNSVIICIHFKGNSDYYTNQLGYIVKRVKDESIPQLTSLPQTQEQSSKNQKLTKHKKLEPIAQFFSKCLIGEDCCWFCQHWIREQFTYLKQYPPSGITIDYQQEYFIHLNCYNYQPIKMMNCESYNNTQVYRKDCKQLYWSNYSVHQVQIPIPSNKDVKYFFTNKGRVLVNEFQDVVEVNENLQFQVFDIFREKLYEEGQIDEKFQVFVKRMNKKDKEELAYNKLRKMCGKMSEFNFKQGYKKENRLALKSIINKNFDKQSIILSIGKMHLQRLSLQENLNLDSPQNKQHLEKSTSTMKMDSSNQIVVNIRKCKQKVYIPTKSEKYLYLNIFPRNKQYLFNYSLFQQKKIALQGIIEFKQELQQLKQRYFGNFRETYFTKFMKKRQIICKDEQFIDKFKIITRKYFNHNQLVFSDVYSYLYQTFLPLGSETPTKNSNSLKQTKMEKNNKNKSVKFVPPKQTALSILINSEKNMNNIRTQTSQQDSKKKKLQRRAISVNCMFDQHQLTKIKELPASINNILSNLGSNDKIIKSFKNIPKEESSVIHKLCFETNKTPQIQLNEEILILYNTLSSMHQDQKDILSLISIFQKEKVKELNDIVQSYNYSKLCSFYEKMIEEKIENSLRAIKCCSDLDKFLVNQRQNMDKAKLPSQHNQNASNRNFNAVPYNELQIFQLEEDVIKQKTNLQSFQSFLDFLINDSHPIKMLSKTQFMLKSSRKRKGKYGRSLRSIKEELMKEETRLMIPTDSSKFMQEIEKEETNQNYNCMIKEINVVSEVFLKVVSSLISHYFQAHQCPDKEKSIIEQWLKGHITQIISTFINEALNQYLNINKLQAAYDKRAQICEYYILNTIIQLVKLNLMLKSSYLQQNLKEYQFISPFHSYQFIIAIEITKITHIIETIQNNHHIIDDNFTEVINEIASAWRQFSVDAVVAQKARKQAQMNRMKSRVKLMPQSILKRFQIRQQSKDD